jgi:DNA-binding SARP family transcriptional activator
MGSGQGMQLVDNRSTPNGVPRDTTNGGRRLPHEIAELRLIGGFEFRVGGWPVRVGTAAQRLLALLAVREQSTSRYQAAGMLWPDFPAERAAANLRSVMWRLQRYHPSFDTSLGDLRLAETVRVDLQTATDAARTLLHSRGPLREDELHELLHANFYDELLPDWSEEWLIPERERFRQLRLHALEALCDQLTERRWHGSAVDTGLAVVRTDPLRESGHCVLIKAYLAEGNYCEALRQFRRYSTLVRSELRVDPSPQLRELIRRASLQAQQDSDGRLAAGPW